MPSPVTALGSLPQSPQVRRVPCDQLTEQYRGVVSVCGWIRVTRHRAPPGLAGASNSSLYPILIAYSPTEAVLKRSPQ